MKVKFYAPHYFENFACIGNRCEDSCCIGWDIDIDRVTFRQYYRVKDKDMHDQFKKHVYLNEDCYDQSVDYGRFKVDERKWCPFLDPDLYCRIYKNLGESYLSNVCSSFPRVVNLVNSRYEISLFLSCPEAARLVLLGKEKMSYEPLNIKLQKYIITGVVDTQNPEYRDTIVEKYDVLRNNIVDILQNRSMDVRTRLYILGDYIEKIEEGSLSIEMSTQNYLRINESLISEGLLSSGNISLQLYVYKSLLDVLVPENVDSESFNELTKHVKESLYFKKTSEEVESSKDLILNYQNIMKEFYLPFNENLEYIFENELVNYVYQNLFPLSEVHSPYDRYMMLILRFGFMRLYLVGIYKWKEIATIEDTIMMISKFTKTIDHHRLFLDYVYDYMKENEYDHMSFVKEILF